MKSSCNFKIKFFYLISFVALPILVINFMPNFGINKMPCELFSQSMNICIDPDLESLEKIDIHEFIDLVNKEDSILEIGPYFNPQFKGSKVKYFDILTTQDLHNQLLSSSVSTEVGYDSLIEMAREDPSRIPNIDYYNPSGDMSGIQEKFSAIFSSHNIEHQIDLIDHIKQVENLLADGGKFYLIIPDKRFCFDHFIPETQLSDVIGNHFENFKTRHPLRSILAMECETTHNDPRLHWNNNDGIAKGIELECYKKALENFEKMNGEYINAHRWRFTPDQFEFIINKLNDLNYINLKIEKIYYTKRNTFHFYAILYKP